MFQKADCNYQSYRKILKDIIATGKYCDYRDVLEQKKEDFFVLRHDIEFSIDRAFQMAEVEAEEGISSSYFVQITNNAYNPFSKKNVEILKKINAMGHHLGLHYHRGNTVSVEKVIKDVQFQAEILSKMIDVEIDRFSFHRPLKEHLEANISIPGLINTYGSQFFVLTDNPDDNLSIKYIADSNHQWKYGKATYDYFNKFKRIQLLIHPLSWSEEGADHLNNFKMIMQEKHDEMVQTIEMEWKYFDLLRGKL